MISQLENGVIFLQGVVSVEEAEDLLELLLKAPEAEVDLAECTHVHTAPLQVLVAAKPKLKAWPLQDQLRKWLQFVLENKIEGDNNGKENNGGG